jgi:D-alanyl-D-alanine carboxypeptidase/D-alanyl-D-alanine-endopeptidase (penicillin-binding protein 4)
VLQALLEARGVEVRGVPRRGPLVEASADTVAVHVSEPLTHSVRNFLKVSDNLTGELLVKAVGAFVSGPPGTYDKGLAAERLFLANEVGVDTTAQRLADGSGVSRYNLVTARQIVSLLGYMSARPELFPAYLDALPVAGVDGTLEGRMRGTPAESRARAKTGTLNGVTALSGYVPAADGERLVFSTLIEFYTGSSAPRRAVQDSIVAALSRFRR